MHTRRVNVARAARVPAPSQVLQLPVAHFELLGTVERSMEMLRHKYTTRHVSEAELAARHLQAKITSVATCKIGHVDRVALFVGEALAALSIRARERSAHLAIVRAGQARRRGDRTASKAPRAFVSVTARTLVADAEI